jgi:hypothetical protein
MPELAELLDRIDVDAYCYLVFLGEPVVHLREKALVETLCGRTLHRADFSTGGAWHDDAPQPTCADCIAKAAA